MDVQFQIRQNAMEMQEYMKDLFDWQKSIKKKERALVASAGAADAQTPSAPAPRGRASGAVAPAPADLMQPALGPKGPAAPPKAPPASKAKQGVDSAGAAAGKDTAAAHTYTSYGKWDKFDVDAALASDDEDEAAGASRVARRAASGAGADAAAGAGAKLPNANGLQGGAGAGAAASRATAAAPTDTSASFPAPSYRSPGINISATDPAAASQEELLRPVATTRLVKPAPADARAAAAAPPAPEAPAAALPPIRNTQPATADAWRARGNDLFKAGEYDSAYECYSRSVEMQPTCLGHANRAMALLKLGRWQEAVEDCSRALLLDPSYVKAHQRRAAAHRQLGAALESARDWEAALRLEPENRATAADRDAALQALLAEQKLQPPSRRAAVQVQWVLPPAAPASAQAPAQGQPAAAASSSGQPVAERAPPVAAAAAAAGAMEQAPSGEPSPSVGGRGIGASGTTGVGVGPAGASVESSQPLAADVAAAPPQSQPGAAATAAAAAAVAAAAAAASAAAAKGVPRTSVEFEAAWRGMAGDLRRQAAYLSAIPPASLPGVFKSSLTAPVLASLVRCLLAGMEPPSSSVASAAPAADAGAATAAAAGPAVPPAQGVALLEGLTRVARFDMMAMSVPSRERQELRATWEALQGELRSDGRDVAAVAAAEALASLRTKYRL